VREPTKKVGGPIPVAGETDTMDTFVDSSFYFIVYCLIKGIKPRPVDLYVGGSEHACMHLIYARFVTMFLYDEGMIDFEEPFKKVIHQGMILKDGQKMSKSKGNVVNLDNYDSDEIRFYLMFLGHYFDGGNWSDKNINGIRRFISRMKEWMGRDGTDVIDLTDFRKQIFGYTESFKFNKVVSSFMILLNENKHKNLTENCKLELMDLLSIYMPDIRSKIIQTHQSTPAVHLP
jgi:leucyl-tRNA synthetase